MAAKPGFPGFIQLARRMGTKAMHAVKRSGGRKEISDNSLGQRTIAADKWVEDVVIAELRRAKAECVLVSEEAGEIELSKNPEWTVVCDPLDGSANYKRGLPFYCLGLCYTPFGGSVKDVKEAYVLELVGGEEFFCRKGKGAFRNGKRMKASNVERLGEAVVSLDLAKGSLRNGAKLGLLRAGDFRRFGPDLLDMCYCACGRLDGFVDARSSLSAIHACGVALMEETCVVSDEKGKRIDADLEVNERMNVVAAGTKRLHGQLLAALKR